MNYIHDKKLLFYSNLSPRANTCIIENKRLGDLSISFPQAINYGDIPKPMVSKLTPLLQPAPIPTLSLVEK